MDLDAGLDTAYCNTPILLSATFANSVTSVHWSSNNNFTDTLSSSSSLMAASIDKFYVKVSDGNCIQIDSVEVLPESINIEVFANNVCIGDSTLVGVINLTPDFPIVSYNWNVNNLDTSAFIDFPESQTWYSVEVINSDGCIIQDSILVSVYNYPIIDSIWASNTVVFKGEEVILNVATISTIIWDDFTNSNSSQNIFPEETKCYKFEVSTPFNCLLKDSICIQAEDVFCDTRNLTIPNAFSPNEDNVNDVYFIEDIDGIVTELRLEIFNRLGQKVFYSSEISQHWDLSLIHISEPTRPY